ncbi:YqgE/AlgH family protein [Sphingomonas flavalba]|uniref:YqgE/AlgH family protein n=1 Tax=Sphingomonas flavalba TaxID=2559804 RepID=UPI00109DB264|nr:YqgE/AlgH family protein [Sphingomonas flavalba]
MEQATSLCGQLLLAMPGIGDPRFERAVIALCAHGEDGALGIGIGRLAPRVGFHDLLGGFDIEVGLAPNCPVHVGGPVEPQRGFVLHSADWSGDDTIDVDGRWALTGTIDVLRAIAEGQGPARWLVALGYAGWSPGQLEGELTRHGWFTTEASDRLLFDTPVDARWRAAFRTAGINSAMLAPQAGTA